MRQQEDRFKKDYRTPTQKKLEEKSYDNFSKEVDKVRQEVEQDRQRQKELDQTERVDENIKKSKNPIANLLEKIAPRKNKKEEEEENKKEEAEKKDIESIKIDGMPLEDVIAPIELEVDFNHLQVGDRYYTTLFITEYPRFVGPNWLSPIINFEHSIKISTFYYPVDSKVILQKLKKKIGEMEATLYSAMEEKKAPDPSLKVSLTDAQKLQDAIAEGAEKFFHFSMYITITAKSKEDLEKITQNAISTLGSINVKAKKATLQQEQGFLNTQPLGLDRIYVTRNMDTTSIATTFPFVSSELTMDKGIMYGINLANKSLVIFDRFEMENANSIVFAKSGAGKSYVVKLEALRSLMLGTEIIIIDPEQEFELLCEAVGGSYISFSQDGGHKMNPFELSGLQDEEEDELRMKILSLQGFLKILLGNVTPVEQSILDRALLLTYREKGITLDPKTQQNAEPPLLEDLYKVLKGMAESEAKDLAGRLERYIIGSSAGIFNETSNVELNNPFTVFSIRDLDEEVRPMAMYLMLDYIWTKIKKDKKRRLLLVDEAWIMMANEDSAKFMYSIAKRARKYYLGVTTITQDVEDFLNNDMGRAIITNASIQMLLKQSNIAIDKLQEVFNLSEGEKSFLLSCDIGQGIFFAGQNHVAMQVVSSQMEHELVTTDPKDLEKMKEEGKKDRSHEELAQIYEPPAQQGSSQDTSSAGTIKNLKQEVQRKRQDIDQVMEDKLQYQAQKLEEEQQEKQQHKTPTNLTEAVVQETDNLREGRKHITSQGEYQYEKKKEKKDNSNKKE